MGSDSAFGEPSFVPPVADLAAAIMGAEEAMAKWRGRFNPEPRIGTTLDAADMLADALDTLLSAAREKQQREKRLHAALAERTISRDTWRKTALRHLADAEKAEAAARGETLAAEAFREAERAAVARAEKVETALAEEREKRERAESILRKARTWSLIWAEGPSMHDGVALRDAVDAHFGEGAYQSVSALRAAPAQPAPGMDWSGTTGTVGPRPAQPDIRTQPIEEIRAELAAEGIDTAPLVAGIRERLGAMRAAPAQPERPPTPKADDGHFEMGLRIQIARANGELPSDDAPNPGWAEWAERLLDDANAYREAQPALLEEAVREAAERLVRKIDEVGNDPSYMAVWGLFWARGYEYKGPRYEEELVALKKALWPELAAALAARGKGGER